MLKDRATQVRHSATLPWRRCLCPCTAFHGAAQLCLPAQRLLRNPQPVLRCVGNTFCNWCHVAQSTWQLSNRISSHALRCDFLHLIIWKCGFGKLWELLETIRQQDTKWENSFDFILLSIPNDQAELQSPGWTEGKVCTCPAYLGKSMRL